MSAAAERATWTEVLAEGRAPLFALVCLAVWLVAADSLVTTTIMPTVGADLGGYAWFGWATAGFLLGSILAGASAGWLGLKVGLRAGVAASAVLYAAGCALSAAAPDMATFIAGRVIQGVGGGWVSGFASVAIGLLFPDRTLPRVYAATTSVWGVATLVGPAIGGLFADLGHWAWVFWAFALQGLVMAGAALVLLPGRRSGGGSGVPVLQLGLVALGVGAVGFADRAGGWGAAALIAAGLAAILAMVRLDGRARARLLPRDAGDLRRISGAGYASYFLTTAASMGFSVYGPAILQELKGLSALQAGYLIAAEALAWSAAALLVSGLTGRWPARLILAGSVGVLAGVALSMFAMPGGPLWMVGLAGVVMGAGFGISYSFQAQTVLAALKEEERALGAAGISSIRLIGSAAGAAIAGVAANLSGFAEGLTPETARAAGVWVFVAALPLGVAGVWASARLAKLRP